MTMSEIEAMIGRAGGAVEFPDDARGVVEVLVRDGQPVQRAEQMQPQTPEEP